MAILRKRKDQTLRNGVKDRCELRDQCVVESEHIENRQALKRELLELYPRAAGFLATAQQKNQGGCRVQPHDEGLFSLVAVVLCLPR